MASYSVRFGFRQHFDFAPEVAYKWCTDYDPGDVRLQGEEGVRKVRWVNDDTLVLTDTYSKKGERVARKKLVRLYPERLFWTNTRISAEGRHSQFLYQIVGEEGGSRLEFTGSQVLPGRKPSPAKLKELAAQYAKEDSTSWRNLAKAMAADLKK